MSPEPDARSRRRFGWAVVLPVAVVVVLVAVVVGVRRADSVAEVEVDATTTAPAEVPPTPPVLGEKQFDVQVSDQPDAQPLVVAAGAGFAVVVDGTVTGYGSDGSERWHYRPTDTAVSDAHVYDAGAVLIAGLADGATRVDRTGQDGPPFPQRLIAFDANTGQQLWTSEREDLRGAFTGYQNRKQRIAIPSEPRFLATHFQGTTMKGFDPRTGDEVWRLDIGCSGTAYTPTQMVCLNIFGDHARAVVIDSATGARTAEWAVPIPGAGRPETWTFLRDDIVATGSGVVLNFSFSTRTKEQLPLQTVYLNTVSGASTPLGDRVSAVTGGDARGALIVSTERLPGEVSAALYRPDGEVVCTFPPEAGLADDEGNPYLDENVHAWLDEQFVSSVQRDTDLGPETLLAVFDRDCRNLATSPLPAGTDISGIVPAPGVTVVIRGDDTGTHLDGYAPR